MLGRGWKKTEAGLGLDALRLLSGPGLWLILLVVFFFFF